MSSLGYFISEGVRGLFQAKAMTFVSIATVAVALFIADLAGIAALNIAALFDRSVDRADMVVYVKDANLADTAMLGAAIRSLAPVSRTTLVDKDAAKDRFVAIYGGGMLDAVDENPLPVSIELVLKKEHRTAEAAGNLTSAIGGMPGVETVRSSREWIDLAERYRRHLFTAALVLALLVVITLHVTIVNSVKLTIYARKEQIATIRLLGGSRPFVALPFIIEGLLQGLAGGVIAVTGFLVVRASLHALPVTFGPLSLQGAVVLAGMFFGLIGGFAAVRRFPDPVP